MQTPAARQVAQKFASALNRGLYRYYGRDPSAAMFARDFNLFLDNGEPISREAARKWMRGDAVPGLARTQLLAKWLNIDLRDLDTGDDIRPLCEGLPKDRDVPLSLDLVSDFSLRNRLLQLIDELDRPKSELLLRVLTRLTRSSASQPTLYPY